MNLINVKKEVENCKAEKLSVLISPLDGSSPYYSYKPELIMRSASTIKTAIMCYALHLCDKGRLSLNQKFTVEEILPDSEIFENGQEEKSLYELLYHMITVSDNTATNFLIEMLRMKSINSYIQTVPGMKDTVLRRKMLDWTAVKAGKENTTTAADMFALYSSLYNGKLFDIGFTAVAMEILYNQRCRDSLLRYVATDIHAAHKTGGLDYLNHDCGIFRIGSEDIYIGVFVDGTPENDLYAKKLIGRIGKAVYGND